MTLQNKRLIGILIGVSALLLVPFIAMQFTSEVDWKLGDFIVAGILLFGTGLTIEFVLRKVKTTRNKLLICGAILIALFLVWAELAVGLFGTPFAGS